VASADEARGAATEAVLWDLGGVLLDWDPRHLYRKLFGADIAAMDYFLAHVCSPDWHAQQDLGKATAQACAELVAQHPGQAAMINAWAERNEEMVAGAIAGSVEVLAELRAGGVSCYALSNMERESWQRRLQLYDFLSWFDGCFISSLEGVMKPDPRYFRGALARFELRPEGCLFVDDRPQNIEVAWSLGIPAVLFHSPQQLREDLVARGLLS
jgi:2-haloacid dehalogenase